MTPFRLTRLFNPILMLLCLAILTPVARADRALLLSFQETTSQAIPEAARGMYERALQLAANGRTQLAISMLQEATKAHPPYFEAHLALGVELGKLKRYDEAARQLDFAREIRPADGRTYQAFGMLLMDQKKFSLAAVIFGEACRLDPNSPLNALSHAVALIHHAYSIDPSSSETAAVERRRLVETAERFLAKTDELSSGRLRPGHVLMAMYYEMKGERERAASELESYLQNSPASAEKPAILEAIKRLRANPR